MPLRRGREGEEAQGRAEARHQGRAAQGRRHRRRRWCPASSTPARCSSRSSTTATCRCRRRANCRTRSSKDFEKWIADGAADPRTGDIAKAAGIDIEKGKQFWSFKPPKEPPVPGNAEDRRSTRFVQAKWAEKGLKPVAPADKRTLIRRAYFDLTGLPPSPDAVDAFLADKSPDAFAKVVDTLLASPQYGEKWARHWLDVARYAEDQAHTFGVKPKTQAWRYRDWVIAAFNADMPYDRFVKLQIAGDLLPGRAGRPVHEVRRPRLPRPGRGVLQEHRRGTGHRGGTRRPRGHAHPRVPRPHGRVRPLPRPQVRPDPDAATTTRSPASTWART